MFIKKILNMYVFPGSHLKVHAAIEPGRAREQSALFGILMPTRASHRQGFAGELPNTNTQQSKIFDINKPYNIYK
jgi:hypothetical protein